MAASSAPLRRSGSWNWASKSFPAVDALERMRCDDRMALAIVVTLEKPLAEAQAAYTKAEFGKALAREIDKLDFAARCKSIGGITSLLSESTEKLAEQMRAEGFDPT